MTNKKVKEPAAISGYTYLSAIPEFDVNLLNQKIKKLQKELQRKKAEQKFQLKNPDFPPQLRQKVDLDIKMTEQMLPLLLAISAAKKQMSNNKVLLAELDQAIERAERITERFEMAYDAWTFRKIKVGDSLDHHFEVVNMTLTETVEEEQAKYAAWVKDYNENLKQIGILAQHFIKHSNPRMRKVGQGLLAIGIIAMIAFIIVASIPSFGGAFVAALSAAQMAGLSTIIAGGLSIKAGAAAGMIGALISAIFAGTGGGLLAYSQYNRPAKLSVAKVGHKINVLTKNKQVTAGKQASVKQEIATELQQAQQELVIETMRFCLGKIENGAYYYTARGHNLKFS